MIHNRSETIISHGYPYWSGAKQLQSETGYIDARPLNASSTKPLATHGRTIHLGQTEKNSVRANVFRVTPESGHCSIQSACRKRARNGLMHRGRSHSFDHLVCTSEQRFRD